MTTTPRVGWYESLTPFARDLVRRYLGRPDDEVVDALRRAALASVGKLAVLPAQDLLDLGSEARLNRPGTDHGELDLAPAAGGADAGAGLAVS